MRGLKQQDGTSATKGKKGARKACLLGKNSGAGEGRGETEGLRASSFDKEEPRDTQGVEIGGVAIRTRRDG